MATTREDAVSEVKRRLDIVEFIGQYLPLKKAGLNYSGRCPFHDEKTPSFMVSPERQTFKCFGCGKGGDVITFFIEKEGLSFPEAIEMLAARTGVELPQTTSSQPAEQSSGKKRLFELNEACTDFWHEILNRHPKAADARQYLANRGLSSEIIKKFRLGFAPPAQTTQERLRQLKFTVAEERAAGEPARFGGRITFPITDVTGRVIGFTGRQMPLPPGVESRGPKYWNTPETPLFHKSDALYGLDLAKESIRKQNVAIIAEGQMDVIGLHAAGLTQAVASSGTALTERQCQLLARFAEELTFCYDADAAGLKAAERGFEIALAADLNPTVMTLPSGKDPGDLGFSKPEILTRSFTNRQPVIAWILQRAVEEHGIAQPTAKKKIVRRLAPWVRRVKDAVERRAWLDTIAERLQTTTSAIEQSMGSAKKPTIPMKAAPEVKSNSVDEMELLVGLLTLHPSLLTDASALGDALPEPWRELVIWLGQNPDNRTTLDREKQIALDTAVLSAQNQYAELSLNEQKDEVQKKVGKIIFEQQKRAASKRLLG